MMPVAVGFALAVTHPYAGNLGGEDHADPHGRRACHLH